MFDIPAHTASLVRVNIVNWLKLWSAQLDHLERCRRIADEFMAPRRTPLASTGASSMLDGAGGVKRASSSHTRTEKLLACWGRMYHAAVLHDASSAMRAQIAELVQDRLREFDATLWDARSDDEQLHEPASGDPKRTLESEENGKPATAEQQVSRGRDLLPEA
jgi:hypothetical protein